MDEEKKSRLTQLWLSLLQMTDDVVAVHNSDGEVLLARVEGEIFTLVAAKPERLDATPDADDYNVAVPWYWPLFPDPFYNYNREVAGRIRDPTYDCCGELSWSPVSDSHKEDAIKLAINAARLTLSSSQTKGATKTSAWNFLAEVDKFMPSMNL